MPRIPFNVDAYTARLIGRENVSKLEGAVIELVRIHMMRMRAAAFFIMMKHKTHFI